MLKHLLFITFIISTSAMGSTFEDELRALETHQFSAEEEKQMRNVDAVTDVISDEVASGLSGVQKTTEIAPNTPPEGPSKTETPAAARTRRIRSR